MMPRRANSTACPTCGRPIVATACEANVVVVSNALADAIRRNQECIVVVSLACNRTLLGTDIVAVGRRHSVGADGVHILGAAVRRAACQMIVGHNHNGNDPTPSKNDLKLLRYLIPACACLDIGLLDYAIVSNGASYWSAATARHPYAMLMRKGERFIARIVDDALFGLLDRREKPVVGGA